MALAGKDAALRIAAPASVAFLDEATADSDNLTFTIADAAKRYWDPLVAVTVEVDGIPVGSGFEVQHVGGKVIFDAPELGVVTVSGSYLPVSILGEAHEWELSIDVDVQDSSAFLDQWANKTSVFKGASASFAEWYVDEFFADKMDGLLVVALYTDDATGDRYEGFARLSKDSVKAATRGLVEEELEVEFTGPVYRV